VEKKSQRGEGGGRILVGDNTSGGSVVLRPIKFRGTGVWISTGPPIIRHKYTRTAPGLAERDHCLSRGMSTVL